MTADAHVSACHECGGRGVKNLGTRGYCSAHLYARFDKAVFQNRGIGLQDGPLRLDWGDRYSELRCCACKAMWVGISGEKCWWCSRSHSIMIEYQIELVLRPPDISRDDARFDTAMKAWAHRLANAVKAGVVDEKRAVALWQHEVSRAA